jgi:hypothetical protein
MNTATLTGSPAWSNGSPFNGYVLLITVMPGATSFPHAYTTSGQKVRLPDRIKVPVVNGVFNQQTKIPYNAALEPPNTKYAAFWYDLRDVQQALPGSSADFFSVTTATHAITIPTLTAPSAGTTVPTP